MLVVFGVVLGALVLFYTEAIPLDVTAIFIIVVLALLEPWTGITPTDAVAGFANPATITVMALLFLTEGIRETGAIQMLAVWLSDFAGDDKSRQLLSTLGVGSLPAGFINNTPVVAMLIPVVSEMAQRGNQSPSKLLIPLSYAAQLGGMLTLIGTSTNLLASDVSARLLDTPFSMFEFTGLGVIVLVVGALYLYLTADRLLPDRRHPASHALDGYETGRYVTEVTVGPDNRFIGETLETLTDTLPWDISPILIRPGDRRLKPASDDRQINRGDTLVVCADLEEVHNLLEEPGFRPAGATDDALTSDAEPRRLLAEIVVTRAAGLEGSTLGESEFLETYNARLVAIHSGGMHLHRGLSDYVLHAGDALLIATTREALERLERDRDFVLARTVESPQYRPEKIPLVLAVMLAVVALPAFGVAPIMVTSLAGMVAMVIGDVIRFGDVYNHLHWNVIFLIAGVIPLGRALERSGGADFLGHLVAQSADVFPALVVLWIFYVSTSLITEVISNNASVVLMIPVGIETADHLGADPFPFVLAVTFAASTAFLTPIGYQTNLFIYGPGGYQFTDYTKIGAPLLVILSVVTCGGLYWMWGL
jgi:di/tricarboxylate transporter